MAEFYGIYIYTHTHTHRKINVVLRFKFHMVVNKEITDYLHNFIVILATEKFMFLTRLVKKYSFAEFQAYNEGATRSYHYSFSFSNNTWI
jgi:hypothetical protein